MVPPATVVATMWSASDTNFLCGNREWFRLQMPSGVHRFLISSPDLRIDACFSLFTPSNVHRFLISSPDLRIDACFCLFTLSSAHRFLISRPDLRIDASFSPFPPYFVHRFLISGPDLRIDAAPSLLQLRTAPCSTIAVAREFAPPAE